MSGTLSGALKVRVEAAGLGLACYRGTAPPGAPLPYAVVQEGIGMVPEASGDFGADDREHEVREQAQVDLYQASRDGTGARLERFGLPSALVRALHGARLPAVLDGRTWPCKVVSAVRLPTEGGERDNVLRDTLTVEVLRVVTGATA